MNLIKEILLDTNHLNKDGIRIHNDDDLYEMRQSCKLAAETLDMIGNYVEPGITTEKLNTLCHDFMLDHGSKPATLGYRGFPKSCCIFPSKSCFRFSPKSCCEIFGKIMPQILTFTILTFLLVLLKITKTYASCNF